MYNVVLSPIDPEKLISSISERVTANLLQVLKSETDYWFDLNELCDYIPDKPSKQTVYGWVHAGIIPYHKGGKKLRFLKSEIDQWLKESRRKTVREIANEAETYLNKKGGKNG